MQQCTQCRTTSYCSKRCQQEDWLHHEDFCKTVAAGIADIIATRGAVHQGRCTKEEAGECASAPIVGVPNWIVYHKFLLPSGEITCARMMSIEQQNIPQGYHVRWAESNDRKTKAPRTFDRPPETE